MKNLKVNESILARSNAEFLNQLLGTAFVQWKPSVYDLSEDAVLWMVRFDNVDRWGWRNYFLSEDRLCQVNGKHLTVWRGQPIEETLKKLRYVFSIEGAGAETRYVFKGLFEFDNESSDLKSNHFFKKIGNVFVG